MKTINKKFQDIEDLKIFIENNNIILHENILLQIFTGNNDIKFIRELTRIIKEMVPHINIIGSTTAGEIIENEISECSTILSFSFFEKTKIATYAADIDVNDSAKTAKKLIEQFDHSCRAKVMISFIDGFINGEQYLKEFEIYDKDLLIAGGMAGDSERFEQTIVFTENYISSQGAVAALLYSDDLIANTTFNFGWVNIGKTMTITKVVNNVVYEIDGENVIKIYEKYLGKSAADRLPLSGAEFPLLIKRDGLIVGRAAIAIQDGNALVFGGSFDKGDQVTFGYGNIETMTDGERLLFTTLNQTNIESIFVYSCMARKALVGTDIVSETKLLNHLAPLSGFFTYGEFYSDYKTNRNELMNQTMTVLTLSEKKETKEVQKMDIFPEKLFERNETLKALAHLISVTSDEHLSLNESLAQRVEEEVEKNRKKDQQIMQQSRLAQMGEMISMIAHQWRQPLAAIAATSTSLELKAQMEPFDTDSVKKKAQKISEYTQHLSTTIEDFRNFFKSNKEKKVTNFDEVLRSILKIIESSLQNKKIKLIQDFRCKSNFETYPSELKQVILNLIKNAEDALIENEIKDPYIELKTFKKDNLIVLEVIDNAGGIPEVIFPKIFDPYFSTKKEKDGTGLGLYMSKVIIEDHCKGKLKVSNVDKGAKFSIEISCLNI